MFGLIDTDQDPTGLSLSPALGTPARPVARLFVALWPGARVRQSLAACRDRYCWPPATLPTRDDKLHLTLHFIGAVPLARLAEVTTGLQVPFRPFLLRLDAVEFQRGGLAVLRPQVPPPRLQQPHSELALALRRLALPPEVRAFWPHVTLARRNPLRSPATLGEPVRWRVNGYALVRSLPDGRYETLQQYR